MSSDLAALGKLRLEELLTFFGVNTKVKVKEEDGRIELEVEDPNDSGRLIGRHGETLQALQHLINMMVRNQSGEQVRVGVDISGYKKARGETLAAKAKETAAKVLESGKPVTLPPMNSGERRMVHMAVSEIEGIETESAGEPPRRYVIIKKTEQ